MVNLWEVTSNYGEFLVSTYATQEAAGVALKELRAMYPSRRFVLRLTRRALLGGS